MATILYPVSDSSVYEWNPTYMAGLRYELRVGTSSTGTNLDNIYMRFDLSGVASQVPSAVLHLTHIVTYNSPQFDIFRVHSAIADWSEETITWNNQPGFDPQVWAEYACNEYDVDITNLVNHWIASPSGNFGLLIESDNNRGKVYYYSKDNAEQDRWPYLEIAEMSQEGIAVMENLTVDGEPQVVGEPITVTKTAGTNVSVRFDMRNGGDDDTLTARMFQMDGQNDVIPVGGMMLFSGFVAANASITGLGADFEMPSHAVVLDIKTYHEE